MNVGGTGRLAMADLTALCEAAGFGGVRTYIASGNVVFRSAREAGAVKADLETRLAAHAGRPVGVIVRTAPEMAAVLADNPFPDAPGNRVLAIFLDTPPAPGCLDRVSGRTEEEEVRLGRREIYVRYGAGMARSTLRIPDVRHGTARNMNTIGTLVRMAAEQRLAVREKR